jgi:hypothetical protein
MTTPLLHDTPRTDAAPRETLRQRARSALRSALLLLAALACGPAFAEDAKVVSDLKVSRVVKARDGADEQLLPATSVKPGDVLQYTAVYTNQSRQDVRRLVASLPIPVGTEIVEVAALPREVMASVDGKTFASMPLTRKVRRVDGSTADEPVPLGEYRYLRWPEQQLGTAKTFSTGMRVKVVSTAAAIR